MDINNSFYEASNLIISLDSGLIEIISLSLFVSLSAVIIACIISFPIGSFLAMKKFYGREIIIIISGISKALALSKCIEEGVNHMWPLSSLHQHKKFS